MNNALIFDSPANTFGIISVVASYDCAGFLSIAHKIAWHDRQGESVSVIWIYGFYESI